MIIDNDKRYILVSVPKTGSISIQFTLGYGHDIPEPHLYHSDIASIIDRHPECNDYSKYAFVRNPWARLVSLYFDFTKKRVNQYSALVKHDKPLLSEFRDFEDLCLRLAESPWANDVFFRSQVSQLSIDGKLVMDWVGRFENLQADFILLCGKLGLSELTLLAMNTGIYDKYSYRKYYTDAARLAIEKLYSDDIEEFGYEF